MKILSVEDERVAHLQLEAALKSLGHEVIAAPDGESAWSLLENDPSLRVVVCDWGLPSLDGLGLCRRVRMLRKDYVCFILLTKEESSDENLDAAFDAGVDEFLTKPVRVSDIRQRLLVARRILEFTSELRKLESFLPICGYCKKVREDDKYWEEIESYVAKRSGTRFSHGICPDCYHRLIGEDDAVDSDRVRRKGGNICRPGANGSGPAHAQ